MADAPIVSNYHSHKHRFTYGPAKPKYALLQIFQTWHGNKAVLIISNLVAPRYLRRLFWVSGTASYYLMLNRRYSGDYHCQHNACSKDVQAKGSLCKNWDCSPNAWFNGTSIKSCRIHKYKERPKAIDYKYCSQQFYYK